MISLHPNKPDLYGSGLRSCARPTLQLSARGAPLPKSTVSTAVAVVTMEGEEEEILPARTAGETAASAGTPARIEASCSMGGGGGVASAVSLTPMEDDERRKLKKKHKAAKGLTKKEKKRLKELKARHKHVAEKGSSASPYHRFTPAPLPEESAREAAWSPAPNLLPLPASPVVVRDRVEVFSGYQEEKDSLPPPSATEPEASAPAAASLDQRALSSSTSSSSELFSLSSSFSVGSKATEGPPPGATRQAKLAFGGAAMGEDVPNEDAASVVIREKLKKKEKEEKKKKKVIMIKKKKEAEAAEAADAGGGASEGAGATVGEDGIFEPLSPTPTSPKQTANALTALTSSEQQQPKAPMQQPPTQQRLAPLTHNENEERKMLKKKLRTSEGLTKKEKKRLKDLKARQKDAQRALGIEIP